MKNFLGNGVVKSHLISTFIMKGRINVSELNVNAIPAINTTVQPAEQG